MIARAIRNLSRSLYRYPEVPADIELKGPFRSLKIALVADHFTEVCLSFECRIRSVTPQNYKQVFKDWKPDLFLAESAFHGRHGSWRYELAKQPRWLRFTKPTLMRKLVAYARSLGVPTLFWNKDDGAFFDAFIDTAKLFDHIFTTDQNCVSRYRSIVADKVSVDVLMLPVQPAFHSFSGFNFTKNEACFAGSYYRKILGARREFLDMVFHAADDAAMPVNVYDRNHGRFSHFFEFRFPTNACVKKHAPVSHWATAALYKEHALSLNVNSVTDSESMCSRRLLEILACGGIAMTNPTLCVERHFRDYCHVVGSRGEALELMGRMKYGPVKEDMERAEAGARYVLAEHTWSRRLRKICETAGL